jgi:hypothetical protein
VIIDPAMTPVPTVATVTSFSDTRRSIGARSRPGPPSRVDAHRPAAGPCPALWAVRSIPER